MTLPPSASFVTVGAGALASALAPALAAAGYRPAGVVSRDRYRAELLAERLGCPVVETPAARADLVVCCVPDDALDAVVAMLSASGDDWGGRCVLHTSGARDVSALAPLARLGAVTFAFHPIQSFVYPASVEDLRGVTVGVGGDPSGMEAGETLARALGLPVLRVRDESRALYHLATAIASNGLVTLAALAADLLDACGIDRHAGLAALTPLVATTVDHVVRDGPEKALTGPVVRGDVSTVDRHFGALSTANPGLVPFYGALVTETVRLGVRSGRLDRWTAARLLDVVAAYVRVSFDVDSEDPTSWSGPDPGA